MKIEELLQKIIDIAKQDEVVDQTDIETMNGEEEPLGVFMPPLQTNIELMKKATGVPNEIDDEESQEYEDEWQDMAIDDEDTLIAVRRNAGLPYGTEPIEPAAVVISKTNMSPGF
jgi:hypothetical protein